MGKRDFNLFEENIAHFMMVEEDQQQYQVNNTCGVLESRNGNDVRASSVSLPSLEASEEFKDRYNAGQLNDFREALRFVPERVIRDHEKLFSFLSSEKELSWRVKFGARAFFRAVVNCDKASPPSMFRHYSVHVEFNCGSGRIEIGEGRVENSRFNIDGLKNRISGVLDNYREKKKRTLNHVMPVILNAGDGGILFHEVLGHSLEADYIASGESPFSCDDLGNKRFADGITVTVRDKLDPFFGNIVTDDEGVVFSGSDIVENGVLRDFISDRHHAEVLGIGSPGHGRTEIYSRMPVPRMYGLYLRPGRFSRDSILDSTPMGIYAAEFGEGKVFFSKNRFFFRIKAAWLIENGRITEPLGEVIVEGNIAETLNSISMVGDDFRYDRGISSCIKKGQLIHVRVGQPTVKIDNLVVRSYEC